MCPSRDGGPDRRGKNPVAASPFGFVRGKSALQAEITLLSGSCTARGAGNIEFNAITKPCCGWEQIRRKSQRTKSSGEGRAFPSLLQEL